MRGVDRLLRKKQKLSCFFVFGPICEEEGKSPLEDAADSDRLQGREEGTM